MHPSESDAERGELESAEGAPDTQAASEKVHRLPGGDILRVADLRREGIEKLVRLKEAVYRKPVDREVFAWEYSKHPHASKLRVFVCETHGAIVASTTRLPATLLLNGDRRNVYFNVDSMVHPDHRRKGHIRELYRFARTVLPGPPLMMSKGSSAEIYPMLMNIGQRAIAPSTFLVSRPSTTRWLLSRFDLLPERSKEEEVMPTGFDDFQRVERFDASCDVFFRRVAPRYQAIFERSAALMNWRYIDIPHLRYAPFLRVNDGQIASALVLSIRRGRGFIVDIVWDRQIRGEPDRTITFAQAWMEENGGANLSCFATFPPLREALFDKGFIDRGQTPRFSVFVPAHEESAFSRVQKFHVTDGDGDTEFS